MCPQSVTSVSYNPCDISAEDYFNKYVDLEGRDIGRPKEQTTKTQKFRGTLWLCEAYPLSLQEQVIPIIDLMAASNAHFKKLRDFITLQIPAGFPVKIGNRLTTISLTCVVLLRKEMFYLNDALNTFYLWLYGVRHMVKDHSDSEKGNPLPPHGPLFLINSKGSFICTIPHTG